MSGVQYAVCRNASLTSNLDRSEDVHGAPTSIQLVTRAMQDEELISYARVIDKVLHAAK